VEPGRSTRTMTGSRPGRGVLPEIGDWRSREELLGLQLEQLPRAVEHARRAPFYQAHLPRGRAPRDLAELASLPLTTKEDLRDAYPFGFLAVPMDRLATYHESTGTSGEPTASYLTQLDWLDATSRFGRSTVGLTPSDVLMVKTPYSLMQTAHLAHATGRMKGATVVPADHRSSNMPYSRAVRLLHDLPVTVAWCIPTDCLLWAAAARLAGRAPEADFPALRAFLVAGEPLSRAKRTRIEEIWGGAHVIEDYGSTETSTIAGECRAGNLHLWADRVIAEVCDPRTGESAQEGAGRLVVTSLYRDAMPLIRYDLGDLVRISYSPCSCGWLLPTIRVLGRATAQLTVQGVPLSQVQLEELVFQLPPAYRVMFWRARATRAGLHVQIEVAPGSERAASARLTEAIAEHLRLPARVEPLAPGSLVPRSVLEARGLLSKPRYLVSEDEDLADSVLYYA
jgi:phenylacetate-CoA ligase